MNLQQFLAYLREKDNLYIYGAGQIAKRVLFFCRWNNVPVAGIIVSDITKNPDNIDGIGVTDLQSLEEKKTDLTRLNVVIAFNGSTAQIFDALFELGVTSLYILSVQLKKDLLDYKLSHCLHAWKENLIVDLVCPHVEIKHAILAFRDTKEPFCRCEYKELDLCTNEIMDHCRFDVFEQEFGTFHRISAGNIPEIREEFAKQNGIESYVVTSHLDKYGVSDIQRGGFIPIQVGAALTSVRKGCLTDDTGMEISAKNQAYSECTALYWIWKNTRGQRYVGLNHYRRRLLLDEKSYLYMIQNDIDVVILIPHFSALPIKEYFLRFVPQSDWKLLKQKVSEFDPAYRALWEEYETGHFLYPCNLAVWKREWFDKYCTFVFGIAGEIDRFYEEKNIIREDRYMGFLFENMTSFFVMAHKEEMKIRHADMYWIG